MAAMLGSLINGLAQASTTTTAASFWTEWSFLAKMVLVLTAITALSWLGYLLAVLMWRDEPQQHQRKSRPFPHDDPEPSLPYRPLNLANHLLAIRQEREKTRAQRSESTTVRG